MHFPADHRFRSSVFDIFGFHNSFGDDWETMETGACHQCSQQKVNSVTRDSETVDNLLAVAPGLLHGA